MTTEHLDTLIEKYILKTATLEEQRELQDWFDAENSKEIVWSLNLLDEEASVKARMLSKINASTAAKSSVPTIRLWPRIAAVACIVLVLGAGLFFYRYFGFQNPGSNIISMTGEISPGRNSAMLTLANGKEIVLSDQVNGQLSKEAGVIITKTGNGQIVYRISGSAENESNGINTLSTANGETYAVILPDNSKVWLNAASSLKYPSSFATLKTREVVLTGEGYFEIAKDKHHPFIVKTAAQEVEVLGTHFNINSYGDELTTNTTLLEGSIKLNHNTILQPGQQADLSRSGQVIVSPANRDVVAWKDGKFKFKNASFESVMRQLARWYNVDIKYVNGIPKETFSGGINKNLNASEALSLFKYMNVNFRIEGRTIIVTK